MRFLIISFVFFNVILFSVASTEAKSVPSDGCLKFSVPSDEYMTDDPKRFLEHLGDVLDVCIKAVPLSFFRAEKAFEQGKLDGQMFRSGYWVKNNKDKVKLVSVPIFRTQKVLTRPKSLGEIVAIKEGEIVVLLRGRAEEVALAKELKLKILTVDTREKAIEMLLHGRASYTMMHLANFEVGVFNKEEYETFIIGQTVANLILSSKHSALAKRIESYLETADEAHTLRGYFKEVTLKKILRKSKLLLR